MKTFVFLKNWFAWLHTRGYSIAWLLALSADKTIVRFYSTTAPYPTMTMHCFCNQLSMLWFHSAAHAAHFLWACVRAEEYLRNCNETITWELLATRRLLRTVFLLSMSTEEPNSFQIIILIILLLPFGMSKSIVMINTTIIDSYNICVTCWKRLTVWSLKTLLTSDVLSAITTFREEHFIRVWRSVFRSVWSDSECVFLYLSLAPNFNLTEVRVANIVYPPTTRQTS